MKMKVRQTILGILGTLGLVIGIMAMASSHPVMGAPAFIGSAGENPLGSTLETLFRIEATTDQGVYHDVDTVRLTMRLLNESSFTVYVGIGPDEPTFTTSEQDDLSHMPLSSLTIGYVILTPLDQPPTTCTATVGPDGTVEGFCPQFRRYPLSLYSSNEVLGHSTRIISVLEIALDSSPCFDTDPEDETLCDPLPLEPGYYLLDCHVDGICGTEAAQAQQIIQIRS